MPTALVVAGEVETAEVEVEGVEVDKAFVEGTEVVGKEVVEMEVDAEVDAVWLLARVAVVGTAVLTTSARMS